MNDDSKSAIIANDLDSLMHRIEALPAHPEYTTAQDHIAQARAAMARGRMDLHQRSMRERFASPEGGRGSFDGAPGFTRG